MTDKKEKQKFTLNVGNIEYIINKYIKNEFRTYKFKVRKSDWSTSVYIDVFDSINRPLGKIRIADHESVSHCKNNIVVERSSYHKVISIIKSDIKRFRRRETRQLLREMYE